MIDYIPINASIRKSVKVNNLCKNCVYFPSWRYEYCNNQKKDSYITQDNYICITKCAGYEKETRND